MPWYDNDAFWDAVLEWFYEDDRLWRDADIEVQHLMPLLRLQPGARVLDLACGPGRHCLELARRGYRVTGIDRTARYLEIARRKARERGLEPEFLMKDMRDFQHPDTFDAAMNLFTAFGYFEDPGDDLRVLRNVVDSLKPGGVFVMDVVGKEVLAAKFRPRDWEERNGAILLREAVLSHDWSWIDNRWVFIDGASRREFQFGHRLYSAAELSSILRACGFSAVQIFGDLNRAPYDHEAKRLVAVAVK